MKNFLRILPHRSLLPPVLGFADGILTALTLAAGELTKSGQPMSLNRALAIAMALWSLELSCFTSPIMRSSGES
jgi:hypothetical protein